MRALLILALAGCSSDPCDGRGGVCISLTVNGSLSGIDQLAVTVDQPVMKTQTTAAMSFTLPAKLGLNLPASVSGVVNLDVVALSKGAPIGEGTGQATVAGGHGSASVTLGAPNPGVDLAAAVDLTGADLAGADLGVADLATVDLAQVPRAPGAPTSVVASGGNAEATITWNAPADPGTSPITSYTVAASPGPQTMTTSSTMVTFTGLTNDTTYGFSVTATNAVGTGPAALSNSTTPTGTPMAPSAPTNVAAVANVNDGATITWTASDNHGSPLQGYSVTSSQLTGILATAGANATSAQVTGLTPGNSYNFAVTATNGIGASNPSFPSNNITAATTPGTPTAVAAAANVDHGATVSWTAPSSIGFSALTRYTVTASPGGATASTSDGATTMAQVTGLTPGTQYSFTVVATNIIGDGPASTASGQITAATKPAAPTNLTAAANLDQGATVSWAAAANGSAAITKYTVTASPGGVTATTLDGTTLSAPVTGLTPGTQYTFTVFATNLIGDGPASAPSSPITVLGKLGAPAGVTACGSNGKLTIHFNTVSGAQSYDVFFSTSEPATGGSKVNTASSPLVVGTANGSYNIAVAAVNGVGDGTASSETTALADSNVHDTLFVGGATRWDAYDCFSKLPDGTNAPTRHVPGSFNGNLAVDSVNAFVWAGQSGGFGSGISGFANATNINGVTGVTYTLGVPTGALAVDAARNTFYGYTPWAYINGNADGTMYFSYATPADLNVSGPMPPAYTGSQNPPANLFVDPAGGNVWVTAAYSSADNGADVFPYRLAGEANDPPTSHIQFQDAAGNPATAVFGVVYAPTAAGTLYASWATSATSGTFSVAGVDGLGPNALVGPTSTITSSTGPLAIGNSLLMVPGGGGIQAFSLASHSASPVKTVTGNVSPVVSLYYVP